MKCRSLSCTRLLAALFLVFIAGNSVVRAEEAATAVAAKPLIDFASPDAGKQVVARIRDGHSGNPKTSVITVDKTGIAVSFPRPQPGDADHPCIHVIPATGKSWDLSAYGHVEAKITNTSDKRFDVVMHVVDEGDSYWAERKFEFVGLKPGETKILKVIFGYQKGFQPGPAVKTSRITEIYIFLWGKDQARSFRIAELKAAGAAGEKPLAGLGSNPGRR
jgi:hypothetical protein